MVADASCASTTGSADAGSVAVAAGGAERKSPAVQPEVALVAVVFGAATIVFGVFPSPMFTFVAHAGRALGLH